MKRIILKIFGLLFLFLIYSCNNPTENSTTDNISGLYNYTAYDSSRTVIIKGTFILIFKDENNINGSWDFHKVDNPQNTGPHFGRGQLIGRYSEGKLWIGLNPYNTDNNVELLGTIGFDNITGNWNYISFIGITNSGKFEALKRVSL